MRCLKYKSVREFLENMYDDCKTLHLGIVLAQVSAFTPFPSNYEYFPPGPVLRSRFMPAFVHNAHTLFKMFQKNMFQAWFQNLD